MLYRIGMRIKRKSFHCLFPFPPNMSPYTYPNKESS